jgi:uncharacterized protein YdeI (YjbR/CyaY-like superfamily)
VKTFHAPDRDAWRDWLAKNHASECEVWLVFYKLHARRATVAYLEALDEALCFGWIDSLVKRLDDDRYARKFTPRKPDSKWSDINRKRYAELKASGRMMPPGLERPPTNRSYGALPKAPAKVPPYIQKAIKAEPAAQSYFESLAPSHRRAYIMWIDSAKRLETKARRLNDAIRMLQAGKKLGLK